MLEDAAIVLVAGQSSTLQGYEPGVATHYAPAGRATDEELRRQGVLLGSTPLLAQTLDAMPSMVMILNDRRQIVAANQTLLALLNAVIGEVAGKRPGEAVGCVHAKEGPDGCGTARHCLTCGAVDAILESQRSDRSVVRECRILADTGRGVAAMDLRVHAKAFQHGQDRFIVAAIDDISHSKRLAVMERAFFHDVLNAAGCIQGYAEYLAGEQGGDPDTCERLAALAGEIMEAIRAQRDLVSAERGDLVPQPAPVLVCQVLETLGSQYLRHAVAKGRVLKLGPVWNGTIVADRSLLLRVLGNMVKNALEATGPGGTVTASCREAGDEVTFAVHNAEVMPEEVQLQIFQRSFSTKGESGRGIGTYSMKLLGERYLGGKVAFTSRAAEGTIFTLTIPKKAAPASGPSPVRQQTVP